MNNTRDYKSNACSPQPSVVQTQSVEGIKGLSNAFVYVVNINSTFFISSCYEPTLIFAGPVFIDNYSPQGNPLGLRAQTCYDFANNKAYVFNNAGEYRTINLEES